MEGQKTRTVEEIVLPIAERMKPCRHPKLLAWDVSGASRDCEECDGTGQVPEFPMLREPCNAISPNITDSRQVNIHMEFCAKCQGRGFLLVITTDALLEAILSVGFEPRIRMWHGQYELCLYQGGGSIPWGDGGDAQDDLRHALALALEAVLQQEAHDAH